MQAIAETLAEIAQRQFDRLDPWDQECVNDILEAASEWEAGALPIYEFAKVGAMTSPSGLVSPEYSRFVTMMTTPPHDPRRSALRRAIDRLLIAQGYHLTTHGIFTTSDLTDAGAAIRGAYGSEGM